MNIKRLLVATCALVGIVACASTWALDESGQRYVKQLASGGPSSIHSAAESIFNTGVTDREVLDVAAETLAQGYHKNTDMEPYADAMAWVCRALGNSGNGRYKALLTQVSKDAPNKRLKKHCDKAAGSLPKGVEPYVVGSVNLANYKEGAQPVAQSQTPAKPATSKAAPAAAPTTAAKGFSQIKVGMSKEEVESLIGQPTATNSHITGKQFRPFNFKGADTYRIIALYKGVGRIVYSNKDAYTANYRVLEIMEDPSESGYP
ncbi:MAG TPA: hypothetical protein VET48_07450 [Steroidobacteraceae bacterium]|nr:hypothetical protein [Steroidobacteraceae bacterium]